jgi:microcystin-dependent protein
VDQLVAGTGIALNPASGQGTVTVSTVGGGVPIGSIILWSGSIASIPTDWQLCDGTNGTPDLRDRFVVGASVGGNTSYPGLAPNATGGSANAVVVSHSHSASSNSSVSDPGHSHTGSASAVGNHTHNYFDINSSAAAGNSGVRTNAGSGRNTSTTGAGGHSHTVNVNSNTTNITVSTSTSVNNQGVSGTNANLPPYLSLAYIQKIS